MVAEKFQPLIGTGAVARAGQRRDVGQRLLEQRGVLEAIADALLERGGAAAAALRLLGRLFGRVLSASARGRFSIAARSIGFPPSVGGGVGAVAAVVLAFGPRLIARS